MEGNIPRINIESESSKEISEEYIKEICDFANKIGKGNYRNKTDYIALEFYRNNKNDKDFIALLQSSDIWTSHIKNLLRSRSIDIEEEIYPKEYEIEEKKIIDRLDLEDENSFKNLIIEISDKNSKPEINPSDKERAGMLTYNNHFNKNGELDIHIHLPSKTNEEDKFSASPVKIRESLEILCDKLIQEKKAPRNITARSWLMDVESIRKRIGFDILEVYKFNTDDAELDRRLGINPSTWGQFVDKDGFVKPEEVKYLFEHREPRYKLVKAGMPFVEFVRNYGDRYKGKTLEFINFEKLHLEHQKIYNVTKNLVKVITARDRKTLDDALALAKENDLFKSFLDTEVGMRFSALIEEAIEKDDPENFLREEKKDEVAYIGGQFANLKEEYLKSMGNDKFLMTF